VNLGHGLMSAELKYPETGRFSRRRQPTVIVSNDNDDPFDVYQKANKSNNTDNNGIKHDQNFEFRKKIFKNDLLPCHQGQPSSLAQAIHNDFTARDNR
jgi:hypothetical protein